MDEAAIILIWSKPSLRSWVIVVIENYVIAAFWNGALGGWYCNYSFLEIVQSKFMKDFRSSSMFFLLTDENWFSIVLKPIRCTAGGIKTLIPNTVSIFTTWLHFLLWVHDVVVITVIMCLPMNISSDLPSSNKAHIYFTWGAYKSTYNDPGRPQDGAGLLRMNLRWLPNYCVDHKKLIKKKSCGHSLKWNKSRILQNENKNQKGLSNNTHTNKISNVMQFPD